MKKPILTAAFVAGLFLISTSQPCTPQGDQATYGSNDTWLGYVYDNPDFTNYRGFVTEGAPGNPAFDQQFGGNDVSYPTNGCPVSTNTFSVRYKLRKTFSFANYEFTVGADDGFRLSLDGGSTWVINRWNDQGYTTGTYSATLNGSYDLVLEYYENAVDNRVSFAVTTSCAGTEDPSVYGTHDQWRGYVYDGTDFNSYKGMVLQGSLGAISFDQNFGGSNTSYATSGCSVQTETFSVRYRLRKSFFSSNYTFIVGADDGYRLSLDGGSTWVINRWNDQSYNSSTYNTNLSGTYDMVLEFFENGGDNRISLELQANIILPVHLLSFTGHKEGDAVKLAWEITAGSDASGFMLERSADGQSYEDLHAAGPAEGSATGDIISFAYTDERPLPGNSFYRLKMTDQNGSSSYSPVVRIQQTAAAADDLLFFPTIISNNRVYLRSGRQLRQASLRVTDMQGKNLYQQAIGPLSAGQTLGFSIPAGKLTGGIYLVSLWQEGQRLSTARIIVP